MFTLWNKKSVTSHTQSFFTLTKILPVPVCPEISSPAQSFASLMKSPSEAASGFWPWVSVVSVHNF